MKNPIQKNPFQEKVRAMAEGFRAFPFPNTQLVFRGETLLPAQAAARFQGILDSFQGVRDAEENHRCAVDAHEKELADHQAFYEDAVMVVKSHFGSDAKRLARFGLGCVKKGRRGPGRETETVIERRTEEVIAGRDGSVEVVETEEVIEEREPGRRERSRSDENGRGTVQRAVPPAPVSPPPAVATPRKATRSPSPKRGQRR